MERSRFSTLLLATSLGLLSVACTSSSGSSGGGSDNGGQGGDGGGGGTSAPTESLDEIDLDADPDGDRIVDIPDTVDDLFKDVFTRYAALETATGRIHLLAQDGVSNDKIRRTRDVLRQHLTNVPGTAQGADKDSVAAAMVESGATAAIFNSASAVDLANPEVLAYISAVETTGVILPAERIVLEGSSAYMATMPAEDNTFGALAALVYKSGLVPDRPGFAAQLEDLRAAAIADGSFVPRPETPDAQAVAAYLTTAMDVHSGIYGHDPIGNGVANGAGGELMAIDRDDLGAALPGTLDWIDSFFASGHDFPVLLPESFSGNFDCLRRTSNPYTARSQHLRNIEMTGSNSGEIFAAPFDSILRGNSGNNNLKGRRGFDTVYGGDGFDTAVFSGPQSDYTIEILSDRVIVEDVLGGHEQTDTLFGIERLQFTDGGFNL
ncbi:MAG: hypothetical protein AAGG01_09480 [Planctomycetota bacterium]